MKLQEILNKIEEEIEEGTLDYETDITEIKINDDGLLIYYRPKVIYYKPKDNGDRE